MRLLIISDTHGNINSILRDIKDKKPDRILHLGDYVEDGIKLGEKLNIPTTIVRGNGDFLSKDFNYDEVIEIGGKKFFLTHGHKYNVNFNLNNIFYKGKEVGADYILFGHTHIPIIETIDNITIMNPGSPIYPRGINNRRTFGIIELGKTNNTKILEIK